jgi:hypothetical protein
MRARKSGALGTPGCSAQRFRSAPCFRDAREPRAGAGPLSADGRPRAVHLQPRHLCARPATGAAPVAALAGPWDHGHLHAQCAALVRLGACRLRACRQCAALLPRFLWLTAGRDQGTHAAVDGTGETVALPVRVAPCCAGPTRCRGRAAPTPTTWAARVTHSSRLFRSGAQPSLPLRVLPCLTSVPPKQASLQPTRLSCRPRSPGPQRRPHQRLVQPLPHAARRGGMLLRPPRGLYSRRRAVQQHPALPGRLRRRARGRDCPVRPSRLPAQLRPALAAGLPLRSHAGTATASRAAGDPATAASCSLSVTRSCNTGQQHRAALLLL